MARPDLPVRIRAARGWARAARPPPTPASRADLARIRTASRRSSPPDAGFRVIRESRNGSTPRRRPGIGARTGGIGSAIHERTGIRPIRARVAGGVVIDLVIDLVLEAIIRRRAAPWGLGLAGWRARLRGTRGARGGVRRPPKQRGWHGAGGGLRVGGCGARPGTGQRPPERPHADAGSRRPRGPHPSARSGAWDCGALRLEGRSGRQPVAGQPADDRGRRRPTAAGQPADRRGSAGHRGLGPAGELCRASGGPPRDHACRQHDHGDREHDAHRERGRGAVGEGVGRAGAAE